MSHLETQKPPLPESTYAPGDSSQVNAFARKLFFISVGSAGLPVLVAAGLMLQGGHGFSPKPAASIATRPAPVRPIVSPHGAPKANRDAATSPATQRNAVAESDTTPIVEPPPIRFEAYANLVDQVGRLRSLRSESEVFQRNDLLSLALISIPATSSIREADLVAAEERGTDSPAAAPAIAVSQAKRIRPEIKIHPITHHRHRLQKHAPPTLLAKIGQSVKKGLIQVARFPREAMERRFWD